MVTRRTFLAGVVRGGGALTVACAAIPGWARSALAATPGAGPDLIERNDWPEHWETSVAALGGSWITPNDRFFVRSHFPVPEVDPRSWRLEVSGMVRTPLSFTLDELSALPATDAVHTLECAGNGRGLFALPNTSGTQWAHGAVGNATWRGVRLASLLERAGLHPEARHVWFEAADHATLPTVPPFLRSIPLDKAMKGTLLAYGMNGAALPRLHGAPLRAIVPCWFGMASTKWVTKVRVESAPSDNHFIAKGYRYVYPGEDPAQAMPVEEMVIKSIITRPIDGTTVTPGTVRLQGFAWAGSAGVRIVEVSIDGGRSWRPAGFMGENAPLAWRAWRTDLDVEPRASVTVMCRATDGAGAKQPPEARPNASGYANNSIHQVTFRVGA